MQLNRLCVRIGLFQQRSSSSSSSYSCASLGVILLHLWVFFKLSNYACGFNYWRRLGPLSPELKLGTSCRNSLECLLFVPHSHCDWDKRLCTCQPYHVLYNQTMCLPASLLGFACSVDEQCSLKVPNSECTSGVCQCKSSFISLRRDKCLPPARSGDFCLNEQQCLLGDKHSQCKFIIPRIYGKCRCLEGYHLSKDNECLPTLGHKCISSRDCEKATPDSYCANHTNGHQMCECAHGFRMSTDKLSCDLIPTTTTLKPTTVSFEQMTNQLIEDELQDDDSSQLANMQAISLGKPCNHSVECQVRDPYSRCVAGVCDCIKKSSTCSAKSTGCHADTFQCRNGQCISWYFVCDKNKNCDDGSDESDCMPFKCPKEAFQCDSDGTCLSRGAVCNGKWECPDGSDEARCYKGIACDKHAWQCNSGQCVPQYAFCNAQTDCIDGTDEDEQICEGSRACPNGTFTCDNQLCRSTAILCSGVDGCGDNSDEDKCEVCYCERPTLEHTGHRLPSH